jgi:hypothetical protein
MLTQNKKYKDLRQSEKRLPEENAGWGYYPEVVS